MAGSCRLVMVRGRENALQHRGDGTPTYMLVYIINISKLQS